MAKIRSIPPNFFTDFLSAEEEEEEALLGESREEDDFILISTTSTFSRRTVGENLRIFRRNGSALSWRCFPLYFLVFGMDSGG